jgi:hypothetical protein
MRMPTSSSGFLHGREGASVELLIPRHMLSSTLKQASDSESGLLVHSLGERTATLQDPSLIVSLMVLYVADLA